MNIMVRKNPMHRTGDGFRPGLFSLLLTKKIESNIIYWHLKDASKKIRLHFNEVICKSKIITERQDIKKKGFLIILLEK